MGDMTPLTKTSIYDQMLAFLKAFRLEENVDLTTAFLFANYFELKLKGKTEMDTPNAGELFQKLDTPFTPMALKAELRKNNPDSKGKMSCIEFLMIYFKKDDLQKLLFQDNDADPKIVEALAGAQDAVDKSEEAKEKLEDEEVKQKEVAAAGGVKAFGANQRIENITKELSEMAIAKGTGMKDLQKKLAKAQAARDAAGSDTVRDLEAAGFSKFHRDFHPQLHKMFSELERNL